MHAFDACTVAPHTISSGPKRRTRTRPRPFFSQHIEFLLPQQEAVQGEEGGGAPCSPAPLPGQVKVVVAINFTCHSACTAVHLRARAQKRLKHTFSPAGIPCPSPLFDPPHASPLLRQSRQSARPAILTPRIQYRHADDTHITSTLTRLPPRQARN